MGLMALGLATMRLSLFLNTTSDTSWQDDFIGLGDSNTSSNSSDSGSDIDPWDEIGFY
jgi:hypothetical protein